MQVTDKTEVYRLVYYGGCDHSLREQVWPYLLGHYEFGSTGQQRTEQDEASRQQYEKTMSEWLAVEAIVKQRDKEIMAANLAKLSSESQDGHIPLMRKDSSLSNDVFESMESEEYNPPETLIEESSSATTPTTAPATPLVKAPPKEYITRSVKDSNTSTTSPDEGLGDSIARQGSLTDSKRSDSCDTDKNVEGLKSESEDLLNPEKIIVTNPSVEGSEKDEAIEEEDEVEDAEPPSRNLLSTSEDGGNCALV